MTHVNLAGRAGRWSAAHWKTAAFGWIAVAVVAVVAGTAVGAKQMKSWAIANGDSRRAEQILDQADFKVPAREHVLVQSRAVKADSPVFTTALADVARRVELQPGVTNVVSPLDHPNAGLVSSDRHSALVEFDVRGKADTAKDRIGPVLATVDEAQARFPQLIIGEFGQPRATTRSASASATTCGGPRSRRCR